MHLLIESQKFFDLLKSRKLLNESSSQIQPNKLIDFSCKASHKNNFNEIELRMKWSRSFNILSAELI